MALSAAAFAVSGLTSLFSQGGCCSVCGLCCLFSASIFGSEPLAVANTDAWQREGPGFSLKGLFNAGWFG